MDENGLQRTQMGQTSQFERFVQPIVDYAMKGHVVRFFMNLGGKGGWENPRANAWSKTFD
jgi:hypothetical protein